MRVESGCYEHNGKFYDFRITGEDGQELYFQDNDMEYLKEDMMEFICDNCDKCDNCDICSNCSQCDNCDRVSQDDIGDWIDHNVTGMARQVLSDLTDQVKDLEEIVEDSLLDYARNNVCFLRNRV